MDIHLRYGNISGVWFGLVFGRFTRLHLVHRVDRLIPFVMREYPDNLREY
jgi:hypothetical protein